MLVLINRTEEAERIHQSTVRMVKEIKALHARARELAEEHGFGTAAIGESVAGEYYVRGFKLPLGPYDPERFPVAEGGGHHQILLTPGNVELVMELQEIMVKPAYTAGLNRIHGIRPRIISTCPEESFAIFGTLKPKNFAETAFEEAISLGWEVLDSDPNTVFWGSDPIESADGS